MKWNVRWSVRIHNPLSSQTSGYLNKAPTKIQSLSLLIGSSSDRQHKHWLFWFHQELWRLIFRTLEPWAEGLGVGLGLLAPEIKICKFLSITCGCGSSLFNISTPPTSLDGCGFFKPHFKTHPVHSCRTSIQLDFWVMIVLYFSCNVDVVVQGGKLCFPMLPS